MKLIHLRCQTVARASNVNSSNHLHVGLIIMRSISELDEQRGIDFTQIVAILDQDLRAYAVHKDYLERQSLVPWMHRD